MTVKVMKINWSKGVGMFLIKAHFSDVYFLYIDIGLENKIKFLTVTISNYYNMTFSVFA